MKKPALPPLATLAATLALAASASAGDRSQNTPVRSIRPPTVPEAQQEAPTREPVPAQQPPRRSQPDPKAAPRPASTMDANKVRPQQLERQPAVQDINRLVAIKRPDFTVSVVPPNASGTIYTFVIENRGGTTSPATQFTIALRPPCLKEGAIGHGRDLARHDIRPLKVTTSKSMAYKVSHDLGDDAGTGCELVGTIDPNKQVAELDETNNQGKIGTPYYGKPDLELSMRWGSDDQHKIRVKNIGDTRAKPSTLHMSCTSLKRATIASRTFYVCNPWGDDPTREWDWTVPALDPGQEHLVVYPLRMANPTYSFWHINADYRNELKEFDESNNHLTSE